MKKYLSQIIEQNNAQIKVYMEYCANFLKWNLSYDGMKSVGMRCSYLSIYNVL